MPQALSFLPKQISGGYFSDWQIPTGGDVGKAWAWDGVKFTPTAFDASGAAVAAVATHVGIANPHTQYLLSANYTAADILTKLLTVDVDNSGLNATTLQGNAPGAFAGAGHTHVHGTTTSLNADDHTQYLLSNGSRNGAATIVAANANATPLTLKLASGQVADGLKVVDSADTRLSYFDPSGRLGIGDGAVSIDYGGGNGETAYFGIYKTTPITDVNYPGVLYIDGYNCYLYLDDTSASGINSNAFVYAFAGQAQITANSTYVAVAPITGEKIAVINMLKLPWNLEIHAVENRQGQKG